MPLKFPPETNESEWETHICPVKNDLSFLLVMPSCFRRLIFLLLISSFAPRAAAQGPSRIQIIPEPVRVQALKGDYALRNGFVVSYLQDSLSSVADRIRKQLSGASFRSGTAKPGAKGDLSLSIFRTLRPELGTEGYLLKVTTKGISLEANTLIGLWYGAQSLVQLLPTGLGTHGKTGQATLPCVDIVDHPRFAWRGMMLDVSRHFFTKEEVKQYIEHLSRYKFNTFHWHLTDDNGWRIEIKQFPKLTSVGAWRVPRSGAFNSTERKPPMPGEKATYGGFYTQDDIREVVAFARELGIQVIPEIDVPGHCMAAIAAYPEWCCTKDSSIRVNPGSKFTDWFGSGMFRMNVDNSLNPSDENVYAALDKIISELAILFPAPYIHLGGDECYKGFWAKDPGCKALMEKLGIRHVEDLQGYFMNRVKDMVQKKGKKVIGWDEVMEGGMSNEATIMFWRGWMEKDILPKAVKGGYKVIMSPTSTNYFDYYQGDRNVEPPVYAGLRLKEAYSFEPVPQGMDNAQILGGQSNLWTENIQNFRHAQYMTFPRAWATSEVLWSPKGTNQNWARFISKVEAHIPRAEESGIKVARSMYDPVLTYRKSGGRLQVEMSSEVAGVEIFYTLDESMPDHLSTRYESPVEIPAEGAITLRVQAYRNGQPIGHLITVGADFLKAKR